MARIRFSTVNHFKGREIFLAASGHQEIPNVECHVDSLCAHFLLCILCAQQPLSIHVQQCSVQILCCAICIRII